MVIHIQGFQDSFFFSDSNYSKFILQEDTERTQINVLAVQAITSLVLSAMTIPVAGNPAVSCLEQQPRNKALKALDTRYFFSTYFEVCEFILVSNK